MALTAKQRYAALIPDRDPFLRRARECAANTIPTLLPPEGHTPDAPLPTPASSLGARGTTHLANKIMMAMYPPGRSSFFLGVPADFLAQTPEGTLTPDMENGLARLEAMITDKIEHVRWRSATGILMQHLIVTGNAVEHVLDDGRVKLFRLDQFVCVRDPSGDVTEIVIREWMYKSSLPEHLRILVEESKSSPSGGSGEQNKVELYTWVRKRDGVWKIHQELEDTIVPDSEGEYEISPFHVVTWHHVIGENYGRSFVEDILQDLVAHNELQQALLDGSAMASRNLTMVRPNAAGGLNLKRRLDRAKNGDTLVGNPEDVSMLRFENVNGMQVTESVADRLRRELGAAFLLNSAVTRDAERVTAYELRKVAEELEGALGGVYSVLSETVQQARLSRLMVEMKKAGEFPDVPDGFFQPVILTGLEALGREQDVVRVQSALQIVQQLPQEAQDYVKWDSLLKKTFNGLDLPDSVRTEQEANQIRQQRMALSAGEDALKSAATMAMQQPAQ